MNYYEDYEDDYQFSSFAITCDFLFAVYNEKYEILINRSVILETSEIYVYNTLSCHSICVQWREMQSFIPYVSVLLQCFYLFLMFYHKSDILGEINICNVNFIRLVNQVYFMLCMKMYIFVTIVC